MLETLVAMTILALALTGLFRSYATSARAVQATESVSQARILAQSLLSEHAASRVAGEAEETGRYQGLGWTVSSRPLDEAADPADKKNPWRLYRIDVRVTAPDGRQVRLETLKLRREEAR